MGLAYLHRVRDLALTPDMIMLPTNLGDRARLCTRIATSIASINAQLHHHLQQCHQCFHREERRLMQILAAPINSAFGIDGCCNLKAQPTTLLIDVGRVPPDHWLGLVVHEYAHAHAGHPGHDAPFIAALHQLCLGLGFPPLPYQASPDFWQSWPHCQPLADPRAFWLATSAAG
jgi:hypothetical protein